MNKDVYITIRATKVFRKDLKRLAKSKKMNLTEMIEKNYSTEIEALKTKTIK